MTQPLLRDLIDIPSAVHRSDFVISLSDGIDKPKETVEHYVVTDQLVDCFDRALGLIDAAIQSGSSTGAYLHGSFGSGKSHFMAILTLLLDREPHARSIPELSDVIAKYDERLQGKRFLLVPYHMVGATSMEAGVLGGYVDHVRRHHPDASLPPVYVDDSLLASARELRTKMGDDAFFTGLGGDDTVPGFGKLAGGWDAQRFDAALADAPGSAERAALVSDLIDAYFGHTAVYAEVGGAGYIPFAEGLSAISRHAKGLGYDGVILFLDELILWFASRMADPTFVNKEGQKVAKLVEAASADRPAPIVSFIARQRDLRDFIGQGVPGAERLNFGEILQWWEGRFDVIELSDTNLRAIVEKRVLKPKTAAARDIIDRAFEAVASNARSAMDTLTTSDADREAFRRVYPFSPALIETLVAVSAYLQRERTALRLLMQLLVDHRSDLTVGDLVPIGDLYDVIRTGEEPFSDELKRHFVKARDLYEHGLRPLLMNEYGLHEDDVASLSPTHGFRADERIVKTLLLAALVPTVGPMKSLTVRRLADLNHGSIATPVPGAEKAAVLGRLRKWAPDVPELQFDGDDSNPTVSLQLAGVDVQGIVDRAAEVDNDGARRGAVRTLLADALGLELGGGLTPESYTWVWRGSRRTADIRFANVRNPADIPDSELRASDRRPRLVIDFPFDDPDHGPTEDLQRIEQLVAAADRSPTVCWLPLFFTEAAQERLGRLVILDHVLAGDRFDGYTVHLSPTDRVEARHLLRNQAEALRAQLRDVLRQSYGLETAAERWIRTDLKPRDQFPTLDPTLMVRPPTTATLRDGFEQLLDQIMAHLYPAHPEFEEEVRLADLRTALRNVERAVGQRDGRVDIPRSDRKAVRKVLGPLNIATTGEAHMVLSRHWRDHFLRQHEQQPGPVTVERLKAWMDHPKPMGLDDRVANLVICAYALANNRVLVHAGRPVALAVERLDPATEVITQELPSADDWKVAGERAAAIFGLPASPLLSAASVAQLVGAIGEQAGQYAGDCRRLVHGLTTAAHRLEMASDADRIETARTARDLLEGVRSADDVEAIRLLAGASIPTTPAAVARSIKTSPSVAAAIDGLNWRLVDGVRTLPRQWASQGDVIVRQLTEAFARDELATGLADAIGHAERTATELLAALAAQSASAQPQPADDEEPRRDLPPATGPIDSDTSTGEGPGQFGRQIEPTGARIGLRGAEARRILTALLDNLDHISTIDVSWSGED